MSLLLTFAPTTAQTSSVTDGTTPGALTPGTPAGSYALSGFDNVNLFNGSLNFNLPLAGISGRGGVQVPLSLLIERHWRVERSIAGSNPPAETDYPIYDDWVYRPYLQQGRLSLRTQGDSLTYCEPNGGPTWDPSAYTQTLTRITWTAFDGTEYELIDQANGGRVARNGQCIDPAEKYRSRGTVFKSMDGSEITFLADSPVVDSLWPGNGPTTASGYLLFSDGTRYRIIDGTVRWIRDRNGNMTVFGYESGRVSTITDSLNRTVSIDYDVNDISPYGLCDRITMTGFAGASRVIRISKTTMNNVLRTTQSSDSATTKTLAQLFPSLNGASPSTQFNPNVTSAVWLPNGQSYKFRYNVFGELARVELPTGGAMEFDYGAGELSAEAEGGVYIYGDYQIYRRVLTRRVYRDATNLEGLSAYGRVVLDQIAGSDVAKTHVDVVNRDPNGTVLAKSRHYFYGAPGDSLSHSSGILSYYPNPWKAAKEFKTEDLTTDGADTALRRDEYTFQQRAHISWWPTNLSPQEFEPANDPRLVEVRTTLVDSNQVTTKTFSYDQYNNQSDAYEYDYGSGTPGALIRRTHTDYKNSTNYTATSGAYILRLTESHWVSTDAIGSNKVSLSTYSYDQFGLSSCPDIIGHDGSYTTGYATRGNVTGVTHYPNAVASEGPISSAMHYDIAGNVVSITDQMATFRKLGIWTTSPMEFLAKRLPWGLALSLPCQTQQANTA